MIEAHTGHRFWACAGLLGLAVIVAAAVYPGWRMPPQATLTPEDVAKAFCAPVASGAVVPRGHAVDRELHALVPTEPPLPDSIQHLVELAKGSVVSISVSSPHAGAVGIHGLTDIAPIYPGKSVVLTFRAAFTGRFPLHFHGIDGAHFEISSLEIRPGQASIRAATNAGLNE
jgi:hypothetical protein